MPRKRLERVRMGKQAMWHEDSSQKQITCPFEFYTILDLLASRHSPLWLVLPTRGRAHVSKRRLQHAHRTATPHVSHLWRNTLALA